MSDRMTCDRCGEVLPDPMNPFIVGHLCLPPARLVFTAPRALRGLAIPASWLDPVVRLVNAVSHLVPKRRTP